MNVGSGYEDDDLLAQANALLEDDSMSSTEKKMLNRGQPMKNVKKFNLDPIIKVELIGENENQKEFKKINLD